MGILDRDGRWVAVNPALCRTLHQTEELLVGEAYTKVVHPDDRKMAARTMRRWAAGEVGDELADIEQRFVTCAGIVWARVTGSPLPRDEGADALLLCTIDDITERRLVEDARRTTEAELASAARAMTAARDPGEVLRIAAAAAKRMQAVPAFDPEIVSALAVQTAVSLESARAHANAATLARRRDIAIAELERLHATGAEFIASTSHELRAPLHAIMVAAELVHDPVFGPLSAEQRQRLGETIQVSSRHLLNLVDDLVDLSRVDLHRLELRLTEVSIGQVLQDVREIVEPIALGKRVGLEIPIPAGPTIMADPMRLRQVLVNLVDNAVRYTVVGGKVRVAVERCSKGIAINIHDDGIGIAPEDLERIFHPFEQVSPAGSPGSGLGLAIAKRLVELHGGRLDVRSRLGVGTTFTVSLDAALTILPRQRRDRRRKVQAVRPIPTLQPVPAGRTILLVEDETTEISLIGGLLQRVGYEVRVASDVRTADGCLAESTPSLVLLDVRLGSEDGLEVARRMRSRGDFSDVPILALTADASPGAPERALAAGCNAYLAKPVGGREVLARIHDLLAERAYADVGPPLR